MSNRKEKICTTCGLLLPFESFHKDKRRANGMCYSCKKCKNEKSMLYERTKKGLVKKIYKDQRKSSRRRNMHMPEYTLDELRVWVFNQNDFEELYNNWVESDYLKDKVPSIDRLDDNLGYTFDNIQLMTWCENNQKGYDSRTGANSPFAKTVYQYSLDGDFINKFSSVIIASQSTNSNRTNIGFCCVGKRKTCGGYKWSFNKYDNINNEKVLEINGNINY